MITPKKNQEVEKLSHTEQAENKKISKTRQVIKSSFAWLHSIRNTRKAHLVRSIRGLSRHIYAALLSVPVP